MTYPPNPQQPGHYAPMPPPTSHSGYPQYGGPYPGVAPPPAPYGYSPYPQYGAPPEFTGMGRRLAARTLDGLLILLVAAIVVGGLIAAISFTGGFEQKEVPVLAYVLLGVIYIGLPLGSMIYEVLCIGLRGATLGKKIVGVRVVQHDTHQPVGLGWSLARYLIQVVSGFVPLIGPILLYLSPLFDNSGMRRGWHDMAAGDLVVRSR